MYKVLVTARMFGYLSDQSFDIFRQEGFELLPNPYRGKGLSEKELLGLIGGVDGLLTGVDKVTRKVIQSADKLKVISKFGAGVDNIDVGAATERGIIVTNTPATNSDAVADMAFALIFAVARRIPYACDKVRNGQWPLMVGVEVWNKTIGIIGLGQIGKRVAMRATGFNMEILTYEKFPDQEFIRENKIKLVPLNQLLRESDFVSIHVPLTHETENLIGPDQLEMMKPTAFLINTSRGRIVDEDALYAALKSGQIAGAAFDVLKEEPPRERRLLELENMVVTPHISFMTREAITHMEKLSAQNLIDVLRGDYPPHIVNREVLQESNF